MPEQINSSADLWVTVEADITGANSAKTAANTGAASTQPSLMVGTYNASLPTLTTGTAGALQLDSSGRLIVGSSALPTGAATAANQSTLIGHVDGIEALLGTIDTDTSALAAALSGGGFPVSGTVTANLGTIAGIATETTIAALLTELQAKADLAETQPVSASTLPLPTGAATAANQTTGNSSLATLAGAVAGAEVQVDIVSAPTLTVSGPLTDTQIRATPLPISGTVSTGLSQGLTDTQLRATAVPVSLGALPAKRVFAADLALDTSAYAVGDTLGSILEITNAVLSAAGTGTLQSITVIDDDDQGQPFDLVFFNQTVAVGTTNAAWAVSDADMANCLGIVRVESADFVDLGVNRVATITPPPIGLQPASGTSIFVGTISRGTGTYTASGLRLVITIERD